MKTVTLIVLDLDWDGTEDNPMGARTMEIMEGVQRQTYTDYDTVIIRRPTWVDVDQASLMYYGAQQAQSEWLVFVTEPWSPGVLADLMDRTRGTQGAIMLGCTGLGGNPGVYGQIVRRDYYLKDRT